MRDDHAFRIDAIEQAGDRVAVAFSWTEGGGARRELGQLLQLRDGRISRMQDYRSAAEVMRAL